MLWLLARDGHAPLGIGGVAREVHELYARWYGVLAHGTFPSGDRLWQYPPGAGPVLLSPGLLPGLTYFQAFVLLALAADAVVAVALTRAGTRTGRSLRGAALWIAGLPLLLHLPLARYDVQVTALAVVALLTFSRSTRACGAFAALGALVKVWPALILIGTPRGRTTREVWTSAAVTAGALLLALAALFRDPFDFLRQQGGRGVQIESLGGTALSFARHSRLAGAGALPVRGDGVHGAVRLHDRRGVAGTHRRSLRGPAAVAPAGPALDMRRLRTTPRSVPCSCSP